MTEEFTPEEETVVLRCPKCEPENPADSVFCRMCSEWLIRQWEAVLVKGRAPINMTLKVGPGTPMTVWSRRFVTKTLLSVNLQIMAGKRQDIIAFVRDPNGNIVAGNVSERIEVTGQLTCQTVIPGEYELVLDNSFSRITSKVVHLTLAGF